MYRCITTGIPTALVHSLARQIAAWRSNDPFGRILVLAPDSDVVRSLRDELPIALLSLRQPASAGSQHQPVSVGLFNVEVVTLAAWARTVAAHRLAASSRRPLPRFASLAVIAEAIRRTKAETSALSPQSRSGADPRDRPNFHHVVLTEIMNLKKAGVKPEALRGTAERRFAREVAAIYEASEEILGEGAWVDLSDVIAMAAEQLEKEASLDGPVGVALFGFTELNNLEQRLVAALTNVADETAAFLPWVPDAPAFALTTSLVEHLSALWQTEAQQAQPDADPPAGPLLCQLLHPDRGTVHSIPEISFLSAPDPVQEWLEIARWIWRQMERDEDLRFSDIRIIAPNLGQVRAVARDVFAQAGIPCFSVQGTSLLESDSGRSLIQVLDTLESGLTRSAVLELITTCPLKPEWTASEKGPIPPTEWDRITRLAGVVGGLGAGKTVRSEWLDRLRRYDDQLAQRIRHYRSGFEEEGPQVSKERMEIDRAYAEKLHELIEAIDDIRTSVAAKERTKRWDEWVTAVREGWHLLFDLDREPDIVVQIEALLEEMSQYRGVAPLAPAAVRRRMLSDALEAKCVPPSKRDEPGVWIGDLAAARYRRPVILIITGLVDPEFPRPQQASALALFDAGKVEFRPASSRNGDTAEASGRTITIDRSVAHDYLLYAMALSSARKRVHLSYPRCETSKDTQRLPSSAFLDTLSGLLKPYCDDDGQPVPWDERALRAKLSERGEWLLKRPIPVPEDVTAWLNADEFDLAHAGNLADTPTGELWVDGLGVFARRSRALLRARRLGGVNQYDGWVVGIPALREHLSRQFEPTHPVSPSRVEMHATCPFRYFVQHVLDVGPLPEPTYEMTLDKLLFGTLLHNLLARFYRHLRETDALPFDRLPEEEYRRRFEEFAARHRQEIALRTVLPVPVAWDIQWKTLTERAWRAVERSLIEKGQWEPRCMELGLGVVEEYLDGRSSGEPIRIGIGEQGEVALHGIVDRVDFSRDGSSARIVDYKSGKNWYRKKKAGHTNAGRLVQLVVYASGLAGWLTHGGENRTVTEAAYHYLRERPPEVSSSQNDTAFDVLTAEALEAARTELRRVLRIVLEGVRRGEFPPLPEQRPTDPYSDCTRCDVAVACGSLTELTARWKQLVADDRIRRFLALRGEEPAAEGESDDDAS